MNNKAKVYRKVFIVLVFIMVIISGIKNASPNLNLIENLAGGVGSSIIRAPLSCILGIVLANIGLFFYKIFKPSKDEVLNNWQKYSIGLVIGIIWIVISKPL